MSKGKPKTIVFRYDGDPNSEEEISDLDGDIETPQKGQVITRKGARWKVVHVITELGTAGQIPIIRAFLTKQS
jgi:hypothetical protein